MAISQSSFDHLYFTIGQRRTLLLRRCLTTLSGFAAENESAVALQEINHHEGDVVRLSGLRPFGGPVEHFVK
jgi:hypothetical protein